jgi:uncharacterized membrane protein
MMYGNHMSTGGWMLSIGATVIILTLIVAAIVWLASARRRETGQDASPGEILDQRLATGEITVEQRDGLREALASTAPRAPRPVAPGATD